MVEAKKALSTADFQRFQLDMASASNGHAQALVDARQDMEEIISKIVPSHASPRMSDAIVQMLGQRSQAGWMSNELKVIT